MGPAFNILKFGLSLTSSIYVSFPARSSKGSIILCGQLHRCKQYPKIYQMLGITKIY